jgi:sulfoxide reductase heme-binding subunit YedZ
MTALLASSGPSTYWYLTRSTGAVALILLTISVVLGVLDVNRWSSPRWPRFVVDGLHRNASMLVLLFIGLHVLTAVLDSFAPIALTDAILPFLGVYRPIWLGLGAVAFDLLLAIVVTSVLRQRLGYRAWRLTHWLAYACWPVALIHGLGTGSDTRSGWMLALNAACLLAVLSAVGVRVSSGWPAPLAVRGGAITTAACLPIGLLLWLPGGPMASDWARRAGTPARLLGTAASAPRTSVSNTTPARTRPPGPLGSQFHATLAGTITQGPLPDPRLVAVRISASFSGRVSGHLAIEIDGAPIEGGGVALRSSRVTLTPAPPELPYLGAIVSLSENRILARVRREGAGGLTLQVVLQINQATKRVTGTLASSPT